MFVCLITHTTQIIRDLQKFAPGIRKKNQTWEKYLAELCAQKSWNIYNATWPASAATLTHSKTMSQALEISSVF